MNQGIDSLIGNRLDAYGSNPQALMERYQLTGETVDLLALQAAANTVNEAKNNMLANAETEMPNEKQALEQQVVEGSRDQILSQLRPGIEQQGRQMHQAAQREQMGIPTQPANNMMMAAQGGIVGYANGGNVRGGGNMNALLDALMFAESGGNPNAVSSEGAEGAYQIMPSTAEQPGFNVPPMQGSRFDPEASRGFARQYLQAMIDRYEGDIEAALIAYNAGATNADRFIEAGRDYGVLPQPQTQLYVRKILGQMEAQSGEEPRRGRNVSPGVAAAERRRTLRDNAAIGSLRDVGRQQEAASGPVGGEVEVYKGPREEPRRGRNVSLGGTNAERRRMLRSAGRQQEGQGGIASGVPHIEWDARGKPAQTPSGAMAYLQNIGKQQQDRRDAFSAALPEAEGAVARAEQERADGGIGYLRRLARKQAGKRQEGNRAARYLAMMQDSHNRVNAADPAGRRRGQERDVTPSVDILKYLAMLQENQNMVDAAGIPVEEETEDLQNLIAGRGFAPGGLVDKVLGAINPEWGSNYHTVPTPADQQNMQRRVLQDERRALIDQRNQYSPFGEEKVIYDALQTKIDAMSREVNALQRRDLGGRQRRAEREYGEQAATNRTLAELNLESGVEQIPSPYRSEIIAGGSIEEEPPSNVDKLKSVTMGQADAFTPPEGVVEEDTGIKPDWNMLREWGAGGMGATNLADALGGSGRAVGAEIARQEKAALEGRILTAKEAQMEIDKEVALAINNRQLNIDAQERLLEYRENKSFYHAAIAAQASQQTGNIYTAQDVGESFVSEIPDPAITAAIEAVDRQFLRGMGVSGGLGATQQISDAELIAQATALNEGS